MPGLTPFSDSSFTMRMPETKNSQYSLINSKGYSIRSIGTNATISPAPKSCPSTHP